MGDQITTARVQKYTSGITILAQQRMSRLRNRVRIETDVNGKIVFFDQVGQTSMQEKTGRHTDTPLIPVTHARRAVVLKFFRTADLVGESDVLEILNNPSGPYGMTMAMAAGREIDKQVLANIFASSRTGEDGSGSTAMTAGNLVAHGGVGMTIGKMLDAKRILDAAEEDRTQTRHAITRAQQISDLLNLTEVASSDFNTVQALAKGDISSYLGFEFEQTELVNDDGSNHALCPFYVQDGVLLAIGADIRGRVSERDDKDFDEQIYYSMRVGATRMRETAVVQVSSLYS